jgi:hypothetical protein
MRGLIPASIARLTAFAEQLNKVMAGVTATSPSSITAFGDEILFVQGEADADGGPNAVEDLTDFRNRRAPKAHVYVLPDPWVTLARSSELDPDNARSKPLPASRARQHQQRRIAVTLSQVFPMRTFPQLGKIRSIEIQALHVGVFRLPRRHVCFHFRHVQSAYRSQPSHPDWR